MKKRLLGILLILVLLVNLLPLHTLACTNGPDGTCNGSCDVVIPDGYDPPSYCTQDHYPCTCTPPPSSSGSASDWIPEPTPQEKFLQTYSPTAAIATAGGGVLNAYLNKATGGKLIDSWDASGNKTSLSTGRDGRPLYLSYVSPELTYRMNYQNGSFQSGTTWGWDGSYIVGLEMLDGGIWKATGKDMDGLGSPYASVGMFFGYGASDYGTIAGETFGLKKTEVENADGTITQIWTAGDKEIFRQTLDKDGNLIDENNVNQKEETTVTENPDGSTTTTTTYPDGGTKAETKYKDGSSVIVSTYPDGQVVTETFENGKNTIKTEYPEGSTEILEELNDGTTIFTTINKNGKKTVTTEYPDGTTVEEYNDGTVTTSTPTEDGGETVVTEYPNGTVTTHEYRPDRTMTWTVEFPDGSKEVIERDADGNITSKTIISAEDAKKLTDAAKSEGADNVTIDVTSGEQGTSDGQSASSEQTASGERNPPTPGTVTNADGSTTTTTIDSKWGRITQVTSYPNGASTTTIMSSDGIVEAYFENGDVPSAGASDESPVTPPTSGTDGSGTATVTVPAEMVKTLAENGTSLTIADGGSSVSFSPEQLGKVTGVAGTVSVTMDTSASGTVAAKVTADGKAMDIGAVSTFRAKLGSAQNRLDHSLNTLGTSVKHLQAPGSRLQDTDMAEEMMAFTKNNILIQSAQAMLSQAYTLPQSVLQLMQ